MFNTISATTVPQENGGRMPPSLKKILATTALLIGGAINTPQIQASPILSPIEPAAMRNTMGATSNINGLAFSNINFGTGIANFDFIDIDGSLVSVTGATFNPLTGAIEEWKGQSMGSMQFVVGGQSYHTDVWDVSGIIEGDLVQGNTGLYDLVISQGGDPDRSFVISSGGIIGYNAIEDYADNSINPNVTFTRQDNTVPEPSSLGLLGAGALAALGGAANRRRKEIQNPENV